MAAFYRAKDSGEIYKRVLEDNDGMWLIDYQHPSSPFKVFDDGKANLTLTTVPDGYLEERYASQKCRDTKNKRVQIILPLLGDSECIRDRTLRKKAIESLAEKNKVSPRTVQKWYYKYLACGENALYTAERKKTNPPLTEMQKNIRWAINRYFYSSRRMSLNGAYEMLLLSKYTHSDGSLIEGYPTFYQFRYFYYSHENPIKKAISQQGLSYYQRNMRPLYGKSASYTRSIGTYEIDATEADLYLVSKLDRSQVIGRPVIYMAVDVASQLIAGVYVGLQWGEESVIECLRNAASDKVEYAARYGIAVTKHQWPSCGLPGCLVTDRGMEFLGKRMEELCARYDITVTGLPPYRPDLKGSVEKAFDLLQGRYKPLLKRQGVIEEDFQERGAPDYRMEASLTLYEFTQIVIHCIIYCNAGRVQYHFVRTSEMAADDVQPVANQIWDWYAQKGLMNLIPVSDNETHGVLLPREDGFLTRRGLAFRHLTYRNDRFHTRCAVAGIKGRESVKVAYDPLCTDTVYLIENGEYIPFSLTGASSGFENATYAEVCRFLEEERALKNEWRKREVQNKVDCAKSIREIAQNAADCHPFLNTRESIEHVKENRQREKEGESYESGISFHTGVSGQPFYLGSAPKTDSRRTDGKDSKPHTAVGSFCANVLCRKAFPLQQNI